MSSSSPSAPVPVPAPVPPLVQFLELAYRRAVAAVVRCSTQLSHSAASTSAHSHAAWLQSAVDATRHSALLAPLTWRWFEAEWRSSGCRVLPLLHAHMQSAVVQAANSALAPPNPAVQAAAYRSESWPRGVMSAYTGECYDTVTALLAQPPLAVLRRIHIYYTLYCLHGCQMTVERYPVPLTRHHWQLLLDDLITLQQMPVQEPYAVLRSLIETQSVSSGNSTRTTLLHALLRSSATNARQKQALTVLRRGCAALLCLFRACVALSVCLSVCLPVSSAVWLCGARAM